jgi:hypothetical protein
MVTVQNNNFKYCHKIIKCSKLEVSNIIYQLELQFLQPIESMVFTYAA